MTRAHMHVTKMPQYISKYKSFLYSEICSVFLLCAMNYPTVRNRKMNNHSSTCQYVHSFSGGQKNA